MSAYPVYCDKIKLLLHCSNDKVVRDWRKHRNEKGCGDQYDHLEKRPRRESNRFSSFDVEP